METLERGCIDMIRRARNVRDRLRAARSGAGGRIRGLVRRAAGRNSTYNA